MPWYLPVPCGEEVFGKYFLPELELVTTVQQCRNA